MTPLFEENSGYHMHAWTHTHTNTHSHTHTQTQKSTNETNCGMLSPVGNIKTQFITPQPQEEGIRILGNLLRIISIRNSCINETGTVTRWRGNIHLGTHCFPKTCNLIKTTLQVNFRRLPSEQVQLKRKGYKWV